MSRRHRYALLACGLLAACVAAPTGAQVAENSNASEVNRRQQALIPVSWRSFEGTGNSVKVRLLSFNDFHGRLETKALLGNEPGLPPRPAGGAAVFAAWVQALTRDQEERTILVSAGDQVGGSPPISALLQDEPTMAFLNTLAKGRCPPLKRGPVPATPQVSRCLMVATPGNHDFDEGVPELQRLLYGGTWQGGDLPRRHYGATRVPYIAANVVRRDGQQPLLPGSVIIEVDGVKVGFVGAVTSETLSLVPAGRLADTLFPPEAPAINAEVAKLKAAGVRAIVVVIHEGLAQFVGATQSVLDSPDITGRLLGIVKALDPEVDVVVAGHRHKYTNALVHGGGPVPVLVTQAYQYGTALGETELLVSRVTGDVVAKSNRVLTTWADEGPGLAPDKKVAREVERVRRLVLPATSRVLGQAAAAVTRTQGRTGESAMGNLVADAQRAAAGTDFALMNTGGMRADLDAGPVTWDDVFSIQPFDNHVMKLRMTGEQVRRVIEQQFKSSDPPERIDVGRFLQVSGLRYSWDGRRPWGSRLVALERADGTPLDPQQHYTVAVSDFIQKGGDFFTVFAEAPEVGDAGPDLEALIHWIERAKGPVSSAVEGRITRLDP